MNRKLYPLIIACMQMLPAAKAQETQRQLPYRWLVSANPLGTLEGAPSAAGFGLGCRLNQKLEFWTEPSLLFVFNNNNRNQVGGYRVILQAKRFFNANADNFLAIEGRIKSWHFNDSGTFLNPQANPQLISNWFHSQNLSYGVALQYGHRMNISPHWLLELTVGLGLKYKVVNITGPPAGFRFHPTNIDLNIWNFIENNGFAPYFPGSLRILYTFGKR